VAINIGYVLNIDNI